MPARRRAVVAVLLTLGILSAAAPAAAATPLPTPLPTPTAASALLQAQADRLQADLRDRTGRLQAARQDAAAALQARQLAQRAAGQAAREAAEHARALAAARARVAQAQAALHGFAGALYRTGPHRQGLSYLTAALLTRDAATLLHDVEVAEQVGDGRAQAYDRFRAAASAQREATRRSQAADQRARELRAAAERAVQRADAAVAAQAAAVAQRSQELALAVDAAAAARRREALLARAEQIALVRSRSGVPAAALAGSQTARLSGSCAGGDLAGYPNGLLPVSALCPLWGTSGHVLRADAAAAFDAMSRAYAAEHGEPLCVTDSYRSLPDQVAVRAAKPTLAAVPGTSNHGWGVALDLCGGAERFDTPLHAWLVEHAAAHGWFLPTWAQQDGSKPEPWHWEYAG